jgi:hypothetical protein
MLVFQTEQPAILFYLWLVVYYFYQELKLNLSNSMSYVDESYINGTPNHTSVTILVGAAV